MKYPDPPPGGPDFSVTNLSSLRTWPNPPKGIKEFLAVHKDQPGNRLVYLTPKRVYLEGE